MPARTTVLKWGGLVLGALVAVVLIAAGVLFFLVSRLDMRAEIERAVEGATGRQLTIAGPVGVSFYPVLGIQANDVTLANIRGGRAPSFLAADQIHIGVEIPPLLHREVVVRQLVLDHPRIALEVEADGRPNWVMTPAARAPRTPPQPAPNTQPNQPSRSPMTLRAVRINNGELSYFDAQRQLGWAISEANLDTALTSLDEPMRITGDLTYSAQHVRVMIEVGSPRAVAAAAGTTLKGEVHGDLVDASFDGRAVASPGQLSGMLRASGANLRELARWWGAPIVGGVGLEAFAVSGNISLDGEKLAFNDAGFSLDHIQGSGDFQLLTRHNKPYISGRLRVFDFDLNPYITGQMPAPPADAAAPATTTTAVTATATTAPATAEIAVVPAPERGVDVQAAAPSDRVGDFSVLSAVNADLEIATAAVLVQHLRIDHSLLSMVINDGHLAATLHQIDLYNGHAHGRFEIDAREGAPHIIQEINIEGVDAQRFLSDAINFNSVEGRAELDYRLDTRGRNARDLIKTANGRVHLEVVSGALRGVDLGGVSRTISNALNGQLIAPAARTPFQGFSATFAVADGVLATDNLSFNTPDLRIPGVGVVDLNAHTIEARLAPRSPRGGITVPFTIIGPFASPHYDSDLRGRQRAPIQAHVNAVRARVH